MHNHKLFTNKDYDTEFASQDNNIFNEENKSGDGEESDENEQIGQ